MAKKVPPEINAGSMADIAFLLLIFFLVTTTMDVDTGITRKLPPPVETETPDNEVNNRNVLKVLVNNQDRLLIDGKPGDINQLRYKVVDFITPHPGDDTYPEVTTKHIDQLNIDIPISKGIVSLKNDRGTSYDMYIRVQNELAAGFNELKDRFAMEMYKQKYSQLIDKDKIDAVNAAVPVAISEAEPEDIGGK
ncbi:MAG: biopolymer transporter ExbD [Bacteroidales bacterium]|nr:biopolymer transporter ExbD [Bacteroidales bacterium]